MALLWDPRDALRLADELGLSEPRRIALPPGYPTDKSDKLERT
jgi:hypothetical protein